MDIIFINRMIEYFFYNKLLFFVESSELTKFKLIILERYIFIHANHFAIPEDFSR